MCSQGELESASHARQRKEGRVVNPTSCYNVALGESEDIFLTATNLGSANGAGW